MHPFQNSHLDFGVLASSFVAALGAHAMGDPWGTLAVIVALLGGFVRLAINLRDWRRGRKRP